MTAEKSISKWFGENLAELLSEKIIAVYKDFNKIKYIELIKMECGNLGYTQRIDLHANLLREFLPVSYKEAVFILMAVLGEENPKQTGMFTDYYWVMPIGKFVEKFGLNHFETSINAIEEITKRNTGEYAIRPFLKEYPVETIKIMQNWSLSENFHLRRFASEGSRPKLPWSTKLDVFIENSEPVFKILENLMEDNVRFVQKSVANNLTDYLKLNKEAVAGFLGRFIDSDNLNTKWIIKHATRKIKI